MPDSPGHADARQSSPSTHRPLPWLILALVALVASSEYLSLNRIYQVDELESVFTARLHATGDAPNYVVGAPLMIVGPMTWIAGAIHGAALLMRVERLLFLIVFWINLCLIVRCAGLRVRSTAGLIALLLVATLAPLWDYGFEIRHDNLLLTALLLAWSMARPLADSARRRLLVIGLLIPIAQFLSFKAFAYMLPVAFYAVIAARVEEKRPLWRGVLIVIAGIAAGLALVVIGHTIGGTLPLFVAEMRESRKILSIIYPFGPGMTLWRPVYQCPLLLVALTLAIVQTFRRPQFRAWSSRESLLPELYLLATALAAIIANPTPFPYNLVLLVPQAAILCLRLEPNAGALWWKSPGWRWLLCGLALVHAFFWFNTTWRHLHMSNARQSELMTVAEEMTDPKRHSVLDGTGLVPTRNPPGPHWLIHSFTIQNFRNGTFPSIRSQLAEGRTPVIIPNYQIFWLPREDHEFMRKHYVPLADDFLIAGTVVSEQSKDWECLVPGRYHIWFEPRGAQPLMDGRRLTTGPVELTRGRHRFELRDAERLWVMWLGPSLPVPPSLEEGDPTRVLVNWY